MPTKKLSDLTVKALPVPATGQTDYFDTLLPSFGVRVSYGGAKTWFLATRIGGAGKVVRLKIGRYPHLGLSEARDRARAMLDMAGRGIDPRAVRESEVEENKRKAALTFPVVSADFLDRYARKRLRPSTVREIEGAFRRVSAWGEKPVSAISRRDVLDVVEELENQGKGVTADRLFAYLRKFFHWCLDREILDTAPTTGVRRSLNAKSRERVLSLDELRLIWQGCDAIGYPFGPLFKVLILTGQRKAEIGDLRRSELTDWYGDKPAINFPASRTKNKRPHMVPASPTVHAIIEACPRLGDLVFTTTGATPVSGYSRAKGNVDAFIAKTSGSALPHWTLHDFRRSMVTHMNERLAVPPHVVEATINHISGTRAGVAGVYNRALYLDERRDAVKRWAELIRAPYAN